MATVILVTPEMLGERDADGALISNPQIDISGRAVKQPFITTAGIKGTRYFVVLPPVVPADLELKLAPVKSAKVAKDETPQG